MIRRHSLSPSKQRLEAYFHSKIPISNFNFDRGDKDLDGAFVKVLLMWECTEKKAVTWRGRVWKTTRESLIPWLAAMLACSKNL
ncbi:hypothetical protein ES332_A07G210700v1 [Gossypium tomentosum]|uniref:Uncharacterized protein n=1 Tax=Gossypium tomentosum TaxID=34277 RepID=A0A5D2PXX5_GOSTO|nr:hypothetical protein ES332_A07G210700v1 [Gossypium tomentosum]